MSSPAVIIETPTESVTIEVSLVVNSTNGVGGGSTNLGYTASPTQGVVTSDTGTDATVPAATGTNAGLMLPAEKTKLAGIETGADVTDAANVTAAGAFMKSVDDTDDITVGATNKFATAAEKTKLGFITVTGATDLDTIRTRVNELDAAVILKGGWDASAGTFPASGAAQAGWSYIVTVAGTVDGVSFNMNDRLLAIVDNASTGTYANNWLKLDYTDQFLSLDGNTGAATLGAIIAALTGKTTPVDADTFGMSDSEASNASKKITWANIKAAIASYYNSLTATLTNKRITARVQSVTSSATVTPNADADDEVKITAQAAGLTLANPTGTPTEGQSLIIRIKDNGTARAISFGTKYRAFGAALPTTTTISKTMYLGMIYNATDDKWDVFPYQQEQ